MARFPGERLMALREPWRTRLLFLSFAVNLVTVPMVGMRYVMHSPPLPPGAPRPEVMVDRMARELPAEDGLRFRAAVAPHLEEIDAARTRMEATRRSMLREIGRTKFDRPAVQAAMHDWQAAWAVWSSGIGSAMLDALADLTPEGRQQLADAGLHRRRR